VLIFGIESSWHIFRCFIQLSIKMFG